MSKNKATMMCITDGDYHHAKGVECGIFGTPEMFENPEKFDEVITRFFEMQMGMRNSLNGELFPEYR